MTAAVYSILWFHIITGGIAILFGVLTLFATNKGSAQHIRLGVAFWLAMMAMAFSGILVAVLNTRAVFIFIGILSLYLIHTGRLALTRKGGVANRQTTVWLIVNCLCFIACIGLGIQSIRLDQPLLGADYPLYFGVSFDALLFIILDWRLMASGSATGKRRIIDHLWRMIGALFFAQFALLVANPQLYPDWFTDTGLSLIGSIILLITIAYWIVIVRTGKWVRTSL